MLSKRRRKFVQDRVKSAVQRIAGGKASKPAFQDGDLESTPAGPSTVPQVPPPEQPLSYETAMDLVHQSFSTAPHDTYGHLAERMVITSPDDFTDVTLEELCHAFVRQLDGRADETYLKERLLRVECKRSFGESAAPAASLTLLSDPSLGDINSAEGKKFETCQVQQYFQLAGSREPKRSGVARPGTPHSGGSQATSSGGGTSVSQMGFRRPDRALVASNPQQCMMNGCIEVKSYPTVVSAHSFKNAFRAGICQAIAYNLTTHELACGWIGALVYGTCFQRIMVISDSSDDVVIGIEVSETPSHPQWLMDTRAAPEDLLDTKAATGDLLDIKAATEDLLDTKAATGDLLDTKAATGDLLDRKAATEDPLNSPGSSSACPNAGVIGVCSFEDFIARAKNDNLAYRVAHDFVAGVDAQSTEPVRLDISAVLRYSHMLAVSAYDYAGVKLSELLPLSSARSVVNLPLHQAVLNRARELGQADDDRGDGEIAPGGNVDDLQDSGSATITPPDERCSAEAHELDDDLYPEDSISQAGSDTPDANVERALLLCKPVIALVTSSMMDALIAERIQAGAAA